MGNLLQALMSDSMPCVDSVCYLRYRLQKLVRSLETLGRIFLKEFLKENFEIAASERVSFAAFAS